MEPSDRKKPDNDRLPEYLRVDGFVADMVAARALTSAFELGLIDLLKTAQPASFDTIQRTIAATQGGLKLLLGLLTESGVLEQRDNCYRLTPQFIAVLPYRDLLQAKLDFAHLAAHDFINSFTYLLADPGEFMNRSGMFRLFNYGSALELTPENRTLTGRWMRITTLLTRYESPACFSLISIQPFRRMLDIGGNSGEFALHACRLNQQLRATVLDLPVVCAIGREHLSSEPEAGRIDFMEGNARTDTLPAGFDLITFKSMLHDWPVQEVRTFLQKACTALEPGGTLLIFERGPFPFETAGSGLPYGTIPILLFAHTLRSPDLYTACLSEFGLQQISVQWIGLDMPFFLVTGVKMPV